MKAPDRPLRKGGFLSWPHPARSGASVYLQISSVGVKRKTHEVVFQTPHVFVKNEFFCMTYYFRKLMVSGYFQSSPLYDFTAATIINTVMAMPSTERMTIPTINGMVIMPTMSQITYVI